MSQLLALTGAPCAASAPGFFSLGALAIKQFKQLKQPLKSFTRVRAYSKLASSVYLKMGRWQCSPIKKVIVIAGDLLYD